MLGEGRLREEIERQISAIGLQDQRHPASAMCRNIEPYLAEADALLITSRYEGGPAVAVEALAQGVPVVSTDCSSLLHDLITAAEAGRIVASRDPARSGGGAGGGVRPRPRAPEKLQALGRAVRAARSAPRPIWTGSMRWCRQAVMDKRASPQPVDPGRRDPGHRLVQRHFLFSRRALSGAGIHGLQAGHHAGFRICPGNFPPASGPGSSRCSIS